MVYLQSMKFKSRKIWIDLYKANVIFCCGDADEYQKFLKRRYKTEVPDTEYTEGRTSIRYANNKDCEYIMWIKDKDKFPVIAHESFHLTIFILHDRGIGVTVETDETHAYLQEYLVREFQKL